MERRIKVWLEHIKLAIEDINEFISPDPDYTIFLNDKKTQAAVERRIEMIGEAMNRILDKYPDIRITDSRRIVDTRNRIAHDYEDVTPVILWDIIKNHLPLLYNEVSDILVE